MTETSAHLGKEEVYRFAAQICVDIGSVLQKANRCWRLEDRVPWFLGIDLSVVFFKCVKVKVMIYIPKFLVGVLVTF